MSAGRRGGGGEGEGRGRGRGSCSDVKYALRVRCYTDVTGQRFDFCDIRVRATSEEAQPDKPLHCPKGLFVLLFGDICP